MNVKSCRQKHQEMTAYYIYIRREKSVSEDTDYIRCQEQKWRQFPQNIF